MSDESMRHVDLESFFTILEREAIESSAVVVHMLDLTSKQVRIPGHVVTTDALQRLCITHVHTREETERERVCHGC